MSVSLRLRVRDPNARRVTVLDRGPEQESPHQAKPACVRVSQLPDVYAVRLDKPALPAPPRPSPRDCLMLPALLSGCLAAAVAVAVLTPTVPAKALAQRTQPPLQRVDDALRIPAAASLEHLIALEAAPPLEAPDEPAVLAVAAAPQRTGHYGTAVTFRDNPADAARQAQREDKIWFVVTISGNFEEACFT